MSGCICVVVYSTRNSATILVLLFFLFICELEYDLYCCCFFCNSSIFRGASNFAHSLINWYVLIHNNIKTFTPINSTKKTYPYIFFIADKPTVKSKPIQYCTMSEDNNQQNGNATNGDVPEIELIIKVRTEKKTTFHIKQNIHHSSETKRKYFRSRNCVFLLGILLFFFVNNSQLCTIMVWFTRNHRLQSIDQIKKNPFIGSPKMSVYNVCVRVSFNRFLSDNLSKNIQK